MSGLKYGWAVVLMLWILIPIPCYSEEKDEKGCPYGQSMIQCLQNDRKIFAGVKIDAKPFGFYNDKKELVGFDIDLVRAFAQCWLGDEDAVEFIPVTSQQRIRTIQGRRVHLVAATMTHNTERAKDVSFSRTYFRDGQRLLVRKSGLGELIGKNDQFETFAHHLSGKRGAVVEETTSLKNIQQKASECKIKDFKSDNFKTFKKYFDAVDALKKGEVDFVTTDGSILSEFEKDNADLLEIVGAPFSTEPYAIAFPYMDLNNTTRDEKFEQLVNTTLQELMAIGEYERIFRQWFPEEDVWPLYEIEVIPGERDFSPFPKTCKKKSSPPPKPSLCPEGMQLIKTETGKICLDARQVTNKDFRKVHKLPDAAVVNVTWEDADRYCRSQGRRLPITTEFEAVDGLSEKMIQGVGDTIKEWTGTRDKLGRMFFYPRKQSDPALSKNEDAYPDIGFRCACFPEKCSQ